MEVKVKINRASVRLDQQLLRQINGKPQNTKRLVAKFAKSEAPARMVSQTREALNRVHAHIMAVYRGGVGVTLGTVNTVEGFQLSNPWPQLNWEYMRTKQYDAFWRESGALLQYVAEALSPIAGASAVRRVDVKAGKVPRGAKAVRVSVLITPARLPEPLQSLVMYPFLQGRGNDLGALSSLDERPQYMVANHKLRGFMPDIASAVGKQLLDVLRS